MPPIPITLVLCDLDDTLFAPQALYCDAATRVALNRLTDECIPIVFCSNKTRAELELIREELGLHHPFICENGAAIFIPRGYFGFTLPQARDIAGYEVAEFGRPYPAVVASLHRAAARAHIAVLGFNDMSVEEVAIECGLPLLHARLAKLRDYNEPFRVIDPAPGPIGRLFKALHAEGLECTHRGLYYHTGSVHREIAWQFLCGLYRRAFGEVFTVACGDHGSATGLLRQADIPLVVRFADAAQEAGRLLTAVPAARPSVADSIGAWAGEILAIAHAPRHRRAPCSS